MSAGNRAQWHDKQHPDATYIDIRPEMQPDVVCDSTAMPFADSTFDLISFDPPHMCCGPKSHMAAAYGHWTTAQILALVEGSAKDAHRVARPEALLTLKWNDHDISLARVLKLMEPWWTPLYGQTTNRRVKHESSTTWTVFQRQQSIS